MDLEIISVLAFFGILGIIIYWDRKNIEFKYGIVMRRTKKGKRMIHNFADKHRKKLQILGNIGIIVCIIASIYGISMFLGSTYNVLFEPEEAEQEIKLVLPSVGSMKLPTFALGVPFWYWIIGIFVVLFAHEPMHALLVRTEKVTIKSFGLLLLVVLPGAFVDPDEKEIKKISTIKKLRIFAAGSFGNIIVGGIVIALMLGSNFLIDSAMAGNGILFEDTIEDTGAQAVGLEGVIIAVNDKEVKNILDFRNSLEDIKPGDIVDVKTTEGNFRIKTTPHPEDQELAFIGISRPKTLFVYKGLFEGYGVVPGNILYIISWIFGLLQWTYVLNIGIGIFNLFPIKPLDGGLMLEEIVKHFYKGKKVSYIVNGVSLIMIGLVLINLFGPTIYKMIV
jgi:membrane-associated protease RseP (regulator of RpoE activity)